MSIRNYNAFIKSAKNTTGIDHLQAQALYRRVRDELGRPAKGIDVQRNKEVVKRNIEEAKRQGNEIKEQRRKERERRKKEIEEEFFEEWAITFEYK